MKRYAAANLYEVFSRRRTKSAFYHHLVRQNLGIKERGRLASVLIRSLDDDEGNDRLSEEEIELREATSYYREASALMARPELD